MEGGLAAAQDLVWKALAWALHPVPYMSSRFSSWLRFVGLPVSVLIAACAADSLDGEPVDAERVTALELTASVCGGASDRCDGASTQRVDFGTRTVVVHRCVEGQGLSSTLYGPRRGDDVRSRSLNDDEIARLRAALREIRHRRADVTELDGALQSVTLTLPGAALAMSPNARCGPSQYDQVIAGFDALSRVVASLSP